MTKGLPTMRLILLNASATPKAPGHESPLNSSTGGADHPGCVWNVKAKWIPAVQYRLHQDSQKAGEVRTGCGCGIAADMVRMCPALAKRVKILNSQKRLIYQPTSSIYQALSADVGKTWATSIFFNKIA